MLFSCLYCIFSSPGTFKIFSLFFIFSDLTMMCLGVIFFVFPLHGVHWASRIYELIFFFKFQNILAVISLVFPTLSLSPFSLLSLGLQLYMYEIIQYCPMVIVLYSAFFSSLMSITLDNSYFQFHWSFFLSFLIYYWFCLMDLYFRCYIFQL